LIPGVNKVLLLFNSSLFTVTKPSDLSNQR
jgi:hypothetical protein